MTWLPTGPTLLFCPADRPERYTKAAHAADMVILDLEDAVAATDKQKARTVLQQAPLLDSARTIVRVNGADSEYHAEDLAAIAGLPYDLVMLPKAESPEQVAALAPRRVIALCETPKGILAAQSIAASPNAVALMWGSEDLIAALGGRSSRGVDGTYRDVARQARTHVLLSARAEDKAAIDAVFMDIGDLDGLRAEAIDAAGSGFAASACIHPNQVETIRDAYRPSKEELSWASGVIAASKGAFGAFSYEGQMVDNPVLAHARRILSLAGIAAD